MQILAAHFVGNFRYVTREPTNISELGVPGAFADASAEALLEWIVEQMVQWQLLRSGQFGKPAS